MARPVVAITKIPVLTILIYYFLNFAWVIGVNTTIGIWLTNFYQFSARGIGKFPSPWTKLRLKNRLELTFE